MKKKTKEVSKKVTDCNLKRFKKEFIVAGPKLSVLGFYRELKAIGAEDSNTESNIEKLRYPRIVLLCKNEGINSKFASVSVHVRSWWDYYHNPRKKSSLGIFKTYNVPKQFKTVRNLLITEEKPLLFPVEDISL